MNELCTSIRTSLYEERVLADHQSEPALMTSLSQESEFNARPGRREQTVENLEIRKENRQERKAPLSSAPVHVGVQVLQT
jgi:hypothetical protein